VLCAVAALVLGAALGAWFLRTPGVPAQAGAADDPSLYPRLLHAVVRIAADGGKGGGCGTVIDAERRLVISVAAVVGDREQVPVDFVDGSAQAAVGRVVHRNPSRNLVVLRLDRLPESALPLSEGQEPPAPGQVLFTVRADGAGAAGRSWTYARGELERVIMPPHL
jgi:hypothetical protein